MDRNLCLRLGGLHLLGLALLVISGCAFGSSPNHERLGSGVDVLRVGSIGIAEQPGRDDLEAVARAGYRTVLTVRAPEELGWNEQAAVNAAGMRFAIVPLRAETIEVGVLARIRSILEMSPAPILLHSGSGSRAALVWGMLEAGQRPDEEILEIARWGGMKERHAPILEDYLARAAAGTGRLRSVP